MTTVGRHIEQLFLLSYSTRSTAIQYTMLSVTC